MARLLHAGSGVQSIRDIAYIMDPDNWEEVRVDINPEVKPDVCCDLLALDMAPESFDIVYSSHTLEHFNAAQVPVVLANFHRVLKHGGSVIIKLPNIEKVAEVIVKYGADHVVYTTPTGMEVRALDMLYGHSAFAAAGWEQMQHKYGFTADTLRKHLERAGFTLREIHRDLDLVAFARKQ